MGASLTMDCFFGLRRDRGTAGLRRFVAGSVVVAMAMVMVLLSSLMIADPAAAQGEFVPRPAIDIVVLPDGSYLISNTGNVLLADVMVFDDGVTVICPNGDATIPSLAPGESETCVPLNGQATVRVRKVADPADGTPFQMQVSSPSGAQTQSVVSGESIAFTVPALGYSITLQETVPPGWVLEQYRCRTLDETGQVVSSTNFAPSSPPSWEATPGYVYECTVDNRRADYTSTITVATSCGLSGCAAVDELSLLASSAGLTNAADTQSSPAGIGATVAVAGVLATAALLVSRRRPKAT